MKVKIQLFGYIREKARKDVIYTEIQKGAKLEEVIASLKHIIPEFKGTLYAVNTEYAENSYCLKEGDVVSVIPPVQGG